MQSHEIDFKIVGNDIQLVEIELDPGETVIAEAGAMLYMEDGISFDTKMGDGSNPHAGLFDKLLAAGSRVLTGESLFITHFTNQGWGKEARGLFGAIPRDDPGDQPSGTSKQPDLSEGCLPVCSAGNQDQYAF